MAKTVIGVISDTHVTRPESIPRAAVEAFRDVERIIHAGDIVRLAALEALERLAPVDAVRGNMDFELERPLTARRIVEVGGIRIGVTHGTGAPDSIEERVIAAFDDDAVDVIVFGHSHLPLVERRNGLLLVNPGSATDRRWAPYCSVARITIADGHPSAEIVRLS